MNTIYYKILGFLSIVAIVACSNIKFKTSKNGLEYVIIKADTSNKKGNIGDFYLLNLIGKTQDDSIFVNSYQMGRQIKFARGPVSYYGDFNEILGMLKTGDSAIVKLNADSFFLKTSGSIPKYIKAHSKITFYLTVADIMTEKDHLFKMYEIELEKMESYLNQKKWNYKTDTATGIKYEIITPISEGKNTLIGDTAEISYLLTYLDGRIITKTKENDKIKLKVGDPDHFKGISRILTFMKPGEKIQAILPFSEAFGESGSAYIEPYSTLIIELTLHNIKK